MRHLSSRFRLQLVTAILATAAFASNACEPRRAERPVELSLEHELDKAPVIDAGNTTATQAPEQAATSEAAASDKPKPPVNQPEHKPCKGADGRRDRFGRCITGKRAGPEHRYDF